MLENVARVQPQTREQVVPHVEREFANPQLGYLEVPLPCELDGPLEQAVRVVAGPRSTVQVSGRDMLVTRPLPAL